MINYHKTLVSALKTILPTHYEMTITSKTTAPCITYMENSNVDAEKGDTLGYSRVIYQVKVWAKDIGLIQEYAQKVDDKLHSLGFRRISSGELYDNQSTMIQKIMTFEALALEQFN